MTIEELREHSQRMKKQADKILKSTKLEVLLAEFGKPEIVGGYALDLMWNPDIDISVASDNPRKSAVNSLNKIIENKLCQKVEFGDFMTFPRDKRPNGCIIVMKIELDGVKWEVEIWFLSSNDLAISKREAIRAKLTPEIKDEILKRKYELSTSDTTKHQISSLDIYNAVIPDLNLPY